MKQRFFFSLPFILGILPFTVLAQAGLPDTGPPTGPAVPSQVPTKGPTSVLQWYDIFQDVIGWIFVVAIVLGVLMLIIAGIMYMTAGGNQEKASKAVKMVMYALVGVAIAGLAWALVNVVGNFFLGEKLIL